MRGALLATALCGLALHAQASIHGSSIVHNPVLNSIAMPEGELTYKSTGGVRLASSTLGLLINPGSCTNWSTAETDGFGQFNTITNVAEGATAITPTPKNNPTGATPYLNQAAYTFTVTCNAPVVATATLTLNRVSRAMNRGDNDVTTLTSSVIPSTMGTQAGDKILMSAGVSPVYLGLRLLNFANPVTVTPADPARYSGQSQVQVQSSSNITLDGLNCQSPNYGGQCLLLANYSDGSGSHGNSSSITVSNAKYDLPKDATYSVSTMNMFGVSGCDNCTVNNAHATNVGGMFSITTFPSANFNINGAVLRGFSNNGIIFCNVTGTWNDIKFIAPFRDSGAHIDNGQVQSGCTPNVTINRFEQIQAEGNAQSQGAPFGNTETAQVYVTDNGAGQSLLHMVTYPGGFSKIYMYKGTSWTGPSFSTAQNLGYQGADADGKDTFLMSGPLQVVGSLASPITVYVGPCQIVINGSIYTGMTTNSLTYTCGSNNDTLTNVTQIPQFDYSHISHTLVNGGIVGNHLTVDVSPGSVTDYKPAYPTTTPVLGIVAPQVVFCQVALCTTSGSMKVWPTANAASPQVSSTSGLVITLNSSSYAANDNTPFALSEDAGFQGSSGPNFNLYLGNVPSLHVGTNTMSSGLIFGSMTFIGAQPSNWAYSNWWACNQSVACMTDAIQPPTTVPAGMGISQAQWNAWYSTNPETMIEAISAANWWADKSDAVVTAVTAYILSPRTGGRFDAGGGNWYGAATQPPSTGAQVYWNGTTINP